MADLQLLQANKDAATLEAIASEAEQGAEVLISWEGSFLSVQVWPGPK